VQLLQSWSKKGVSDLAAFGLSCTRTPRSFNLPLSKVASAGPTIRQSSLHVPRSTDFLACGRRGTNDRFVLSPHVSGGRESGQLVAVGGQSAPRRNLQNNVCGQRALQTRRPPALGIPNKLFATLAITSSRETIRIRAAVCLVVTGNLHGT
jgi:hypothetical protein